jgi:hypothetical protein
MPMPGYVPHVMTFAELLVCLLIFARAYLTMALNMMICVANWRVV